MEDLALHTGSQKVYWEDNTSCIYFSEDKIVTPIFKHIEIPVYFSTRKIWLWYLYSKI